MCGINWTTQTFNFKSQRGAFFSSRLSINIKITQALLMFIDSKGTECILTPANFDELEIIDRSFFHPCFRCSVINDKSNMFLLHILCWCMICRRATNDCRSTCHMWCKDSYRSRSGCKSLQFPSTNKSIQLKLFLCYDLFTSPLSFHPRDIVTWYDMTPNLHFHSHFDSTIPFLFYFLVGWTTSLTYISFT